MLIDFQQHYTPPELLKGEPGKATADLDRDGNPHYLLNPLLADLGAHIRVMDTAGIDAGVLTCGAISRTLRFAASSTIACAKPSARIPAVSSVWLMCPRLKLRKRRPN